MVVFACESCAAIPYYRDINPGMVEMALYALAQLEAG